MTKTYLITIFLLRPRLQYLELFANAMSTTRSKVITVNNDIIYCILSKICMPQLYILYDIL